MYSQFMMHGQKDIKLAYDSCILCPWRVMIIGTQHTTVVYIFSAGL